MLQSHKINEKNINDIISVQHTIFPNEKEVNFFKLSLKIQQAKEEKEKIDSKYLKQNLTYYLVTNEEGEMVGIWGYYHVDTSDEAWLGWFGVLPQFRRHGYGAEIFRIFEKWATDKGLHAIRLYTDDVDNAEACKLYERMGMTKEYYQNPHDITHEIGNIVIFSKALNGYSFKPWNSKYIGLNEMSKQFEK